MDATVVTLANGDLAGRKPGNALDQRLTVIEESNEGMRRVFYNSRLFGEYELHTRERRNDAIVVFMAVLADKGVYVKRNALSRQDYAAAVRARWPGHDQHLLAAALPGSDVTVFVTEQRHASCAGAIKRSFGVRVVRL